MYNKIFCISNRRGNGKNTMQENKTFFNHSSSFYYQSKSNRILNPHLHILFLKEFSFMIMR